MNISLIYLILPVVSVGTIYMALNNEWVALFGSFLTAAVFWWGFVRANPRWVGMELIVVILATYYVHDIYAVLWMTASALAGGAGAWLTYRDANEDDFLFLPAAVALVSFGVLLWLGLGGQFDQAEARLEGMTEQWKQQVELELSAVEALNQKTIISREDWESFEPYFAPWAIAFFIGLWALGLWISGRLVRRRMGLLKPPRGLLILFRMHQRYIFLLIAGLIFAILGSFYDWRAGMIIALPIFVVVYIAGFCEGLAVILFHGTLRRKLGQQRAGLWFKLIGVVAIFTLPHLGALLGLADVWFDFRRIDPAHRPPEKSA